MGIQLAAQLAFLACQLLPELLQLLIERLIVSLITATRIQVLQHIYSAHLEQIIATTQDNAGFA
jgi:hypothetical protein